MSKGPGFDICPESLASDVVRTLVAALDAELYERYPEEGAVFTRLEGEEVGPRRGVMLVAYVDGVAAGRAGLRLLDAGRAEVKRMYVAPSQRGRGLGRALLDALTDEALRLGATQLVLESGERLVEARWRCTGAPASCPFPASARTSIRPSASVSERSWETRIRGSARRHDAAGFNPRSVHTIELVVLP